MSNQQALQHLALTSDFVPELDVARAEGVFVFDQKGRRWIDFISGICVNNVGHSHPRVVKAIQDQAARYLHPHVYGEVIMTPQVAYAERLSRFLGEGMEQVYFTNSGSEAVEAALKVAKKFTGRRQLISFEGAYHGSTHGSMSVSGIPSAKEGYGPFLPETLLIPYNDFDALGQITTETACVLVEVIQGGGGAVMPSPGYLPTLAARCREAGALLLVDEIQTGFGRTGTLFAHQWAGIQPDILILAKALGGGLPLGAFVSRREIMDIIRRNPALGHITTFGGGPLAAAAGLAAFEVLIEEQLTERVPELEEILLERLRHPAIAELRGKGLLYGLLFHDKETAYRTQARAYELGLLSLGFLSIEHGLRLCPPLTISHGEMHMACDILLEAMGE